MAQLEKAEYFLSDRQRCAEYYINELKDLNCNDLPVCKYTFEDPAWHLIPVVIKPKAPVSRDEFIQHMVYYEIGTSVHYKPPHRMTYYKETYNLNLEDYPNTEKIWKGTVSLPVYPDLSDEELNFICQIVRKILT